MSGHPIDVLFVCIENAGRSQMAEAFASKYGLRAESAGTVPSEKVNQAVVVAMREAGIDLQERKPRMLTREAIDRASVVVTMGCSVESVCPKPILAQMQKKLIEWHIEDPKGKDMDTVRTIREDVEEKVKALSFELLNS